MPMSIKVLLLPITAIIMFFACLISYSLEFFGVLPPNTTIQVFIFFVVVLIVEVILLVCVFRRIG